jgi:hypothetical protein
LRIWRNWNAKGGGQEERRIFAWVVAIWLAIVLEGALRKWLLPVPLRPIAYFTKDAIAVIFLLTHRFPRGEPFLRRLHQWVRLLGVVLLVPALIGIVTQPAGAVVVLKNAFLWPLLGVSLAARWSSWLSRQFVLLLVWTVIPMAALGVVQFGAGIDSPLNHYAWTAEHRVGDVATFAAEQKVRATGSFSYIAGLTSFAMVSFCILLSRLMVERGGTRTLLTVAALGAAVCCGMVTGARTFLVFGALVCVCSVTVFQDKGSLKKTAVLILVLTGFGLSLSTGVGSTFWNRWLSTDEEDFGNRVTGGGTVASYLALLTERPLGVGLGAGATANAFFQMQSGLQSEVSLAEDTRQRATGEAGLFGILGMACTAILVLFPVLRYRRSRDASVRGYSAIVGIPALIVGTGPLWYDHNAAALWWIVFALWAGEGAAMERRLSNQMNGLNRAARPWMQKAALR